jgi:hypothetical protein
MTYIFANPRQVRLEVADYPSLPTPPFKKSPICKSYHHHLSMTSKLRNIQ